jgi:protein TonB
VTTHTVLVSAAMALVAELTPPPPTDTFKWDVSVVQAPPAPAEPIAPPPVAETPPPPQPVTTPPPRKTQSVKTEPVIQAQQPVRQVQPVQEVQPIQEVQPVQEIQPVQESMPVETAQPVPQLTQQQVETVTRSIQEEVRPTTEIAQTVTRAETSVEQAQSVEQQLSAAPQVMTQPVVAAHPGQSSQSQPIMAAPSVADRGRIEESQASVEAPQQVEQAVVDRAVPTVQQRAVRHRTIHARPGERPDYGWLSQALWSTVEQRKRYPAEARRNHWEGKVILRLTIEQRGASVHLLNLVLEESSGHHILDRHTLDMVRNAFPLEVKHRLSQSKVELDLPFSYRME